MKLFHRDNSNPNPPSAAPPPLSPITRAASTGGGGTGNIPAVVVPQPTFDVQDFSSPVKVQVTAVPSLEIVPADDDDEIGCAVTVECADGGDDPSSSSSPSRPTELRTDLSVDDDKGGDKPEKVPLVRKLSRGASFKSLFGGGSKAPKSTPALSPCATPKIHPASPSR